MNLSPTHVVVLLIPLVVIALVITGAVFLVKYLRRRSRERQELLELMRRQAGPRKDDGGM